MQHFAVAVKIAPARARLAGVATGRTAAAPPSPHIGMRGFPIRERLIHNHSRSGLVRSSGTHISATRPQLNYSVTSVRDPRRSYEARGI